MKLLASPRIIFMGTPDFALPSLKALVETGEKVTAVYTQPDRPKGRGKKIQTSPIKELALSCKLPIFQPTSLKDVFVQAKMAELKPDLLIVVAYGLILPQLILDIPSWGALNVHASLLPKYRGAAPIQWAIISGEKETGITIMRLDAGMDTGAILLQEREQIFETDTAQTLHDRLSKLGSRLLLQTVALLRQDALIPQPQVHSQASYASILKKGQGEIHWELPALEIDRWIRGLSPWPGAFTFLQGKRLIIHRAKPELSEIQGTPGLILSLDQGCLRIQTGQGILTVSEAQLEGRRRMSSDELIRGASLKVGDQLGI